ncbi:MAG: NUDIX hydrolase [Ruminococcaceae bacterium]|nr:NUDIX hydrolase [Oscillospiraceae bacterium]
MNLEEKQLSFEYKFKGKIINLRVDTALLPNGATATREVVEHNGGICVVPITEKGEVLMVEQYRYPYSEVVLEIPAGKRDGDEEPLEGGKRELKEETGATAQNYTFLGELYPTPGYCGEVIYMYLATGLSYGETNPDEDEFLNVKKIPLETAVQMIMNGEIKDAKTQAAILKTERLLKNDF